MVYRLVSKTNGPKGHEGSSPSLPTIRLKIVWRKSCGVGAQRRDRLQTDPIGLTRVEKVPPPAQKKNNNL